MQPMLPVSLVEIAPPVVLSNVQDPDQIADLHSRVLDTVNLRPDRVQTIYPGDSKTILAYGKDVVVSALTPDEIKEGVVAEVVDFPLLIQRILSLGLRRTAVAAQMPKDTTIVPLGKPLASPGPTVTSPSITGMEVRYAVYVPADQGGQQEALEPTPIFDSPLVPAGVA